MTNKYNLLINTYGIESRVALVKDTDLTELFIERKRKFSNVGNVYKGKVLRVLPGMQAAFVDIGMEKAAFLYVNDIVGGRLPEKIRLFLSDNDEFQEGIEEEEEVDIDLDLDSLALIQIPKIEDLISPGQDILVQVAKDPLGSKGSRVTGYITLPGRHLVYMPYVDHIGISRKILNENERTRLKDIMEDIRSDKGGYIIRTVAEGQELEKIEADKEYLELLWENIKEKYNKTPAPSLIFKELDLVLRCVRDLFTSDIAICLVDSDEHYKRVKEFVTTFMPKFIDRVAIYHGDEPIFDSYDLEPQISQALTKKVWLKSGGYIVFERTEALTTIDVNTGSFVGQRDLEETITQINIEAAKEIPIQLRIRNIGGLVVIDFIDMENETNRAKVTQTITEAISHDRARHMILPISQFGLMQITRQRTRESLLSKMTEPCNCCNGTGYCRSYESICSEIIRALIRKGKSIQSESIQLKCNPKITDILAHEYQNWIDKLEASFSKNINLYSSEDLNITEFSILTDKKSK
jgi:ribonuclease G